MSSPTTDKRIKSRRIAAKPLSRSIDVNQKIEPYQIGKVAKPVVMGRKNTTKVAFFRPGRPVLKMGSVARSMKRNVEIAYNEATKGMSKNDKEAMVYFLWDTVDHIAEKIGVTEPEALTQVTQVTQTQKENSRFIDSLKIEAESARAEHIASKKLLPSGAFQEKLGISKQAISKAIKENRMFAILGPSGENFYPAFFAEEKYDRRNLEKVCKALGTLPGASKWQFFTTPKGSLDGKTPLEALALGKIDAVMISAAGFVER